VRILFAVIRVFDHLRFLVLATLFVRLVLYSGLSHSPAGRAERRIVILFAVLVAIFIKRIVTVTPGEPLIIVFDVGPSISVGALSGELGPSWARFLGAPSGARFRGVEVLVFGVRLIGVKALEDIALPL